MIIHQDVYVSIIMLAFSAFMYIEALRMHSEASLFPRTVIPLFAILALLILFSGIKKSKTYIMKAQNNSDEKMKDDSISLAKLKIPVGVSSVVVLYLIFISLLGFFIASFIFAIGLMHFCQMRDLKKMLFVAFSANLFVYILFVMQLNLRLPTGFLF